MKKLVVILVMMCFVLSVSGLSFAQTPAPTALEKANEKAKFNREDVKSAPKPNTDKVKAEKEKAVQEKGDKEKAAKDKVAKEKATQEKAGKGKVQTGKEKMKPQVEAVKNQ